VGLGHIIALVGNVLHVEGAAVVPDEKFANPVMPSGIEIERLLVTFVKERFRAARESYVFAARSPVPAREETTAPIGI